ncbi:MAG: chromate efflux transporter [Saprospiraceae bacterium]|jgi:chromate transporter|nr:chromate efflux transporter [Saprospiraceae bacterium]
MNEKTSLRELATLFLKLGVIAFGGPAAHIAMLENEVVRKRNWMSHEHFLDLVGATNLIPGPNSTEMVMHCGHERAGWKGLVVAGVCFILPAVLITAAFAWAYQRYGQLPQVNAFVYGIKPAVIAIILSALVPLGKKALKNAELGILGVATVVACLLGVHEIAAMFGCGLMGVLLYWLKNRSRALPGFFPVSLLQVAAPLLPVGNLKIFGIFLKVGALLYGSGYVLFAFLDAELVSRGLLSRDQLIDAVAVGQFTPGPVLSTATFVGWQLNGPAGALVATVGIFLPSFLFVALLNPLIPRLRRSKVMSAFLDAVNVAAIAVILVVCLEMGRAALTDWKTLLIAVLSFGALLVFKKMNSVLVVAGGAALGYVLALI